MSKQKRIVVGSRVKRGQDAGTVKGMKFSVRPPFHALRLQVRWDTSNLTTWVRISDVNI